MGIRGKFTFGGVSSDALGLIISCPVYPIPERDEEQVEIPGRNGSLLFDNNRYKNVTITYDCLIKDYVKNGNAVRALLASKTGYQRLEDSYRPDIYRIARLSGQMQPTPGPHKRTAEISISFDCIPQCYIKAGETPITVKNGDTIYNGYPFAAAPLIRVYGYGNLYIGHALVTISKFSDSYIDIDCNTMDAFCGANNLNSSITLAEDSFPRLLPGTNGIKTDDTITKITITPRWWTL